MAPWPASARERPTNRGSTRSSHDMVTHSSFILPSGLRTSHAPCPSHSRICPKRPRNSMSMGLLPVRLLNGRESEASASIPTTAPPTSVGPDISAELRKRIQMLYVAHISEAGVDYRAMKQSPQFAAYVQQTTRLPFLDLHEALPDDAHKIAFFVNLYNAATQHAVTVLGPPRASSFMRLLFAMTVAYQVGPYRLSLNDMENGILRANRAVSILPKPFAKRDKRKHLSVQAIDPRIHFVLNCAANSCPPVLFLTPQNLEYSLSVATKGFLANDENFSVEGTNVSLSKIFDWYREDFSANASEKGILEFVVAHANPNLTKVKSLKNLVENRMRDVSIKWLPYDWALNNST